MHAFLSFLKDLEDLKQPITVIAITADNGDWWYYVTTSHCYIGWWYIRLWYVIATYDYIILNQTTVYSKKYAHSFSFAVLCCGYTLTDFPISIRLTSLALWQSNDCPSASKATLMNMDKYFMWIHYERLHNHNKAKHNKTVCIFLGIYCGLWFLVKGSNRILVGWHTNMVKPEYRENKRAYHSQLGDCFKIIT